MALFMRYGFFVCVTSKFLLPAEAEPVPYGVELYGPDGDGINGRIGMICRHPDGTDN
jgi:hypothetical protein